MRRFNSVIRHGAIRHGAILGFALVLTGAAFAQQPDQDAATGALLKGVGDAVKKIQEVFPPYLNRVHAEELLAGSINGMLEQVDPSGNSYAIAKDRLPAPGASRPQLVIRNRLGAPTIASVVVHSEASQHDIRQGDIVMRVDGEPSLGHSAMELDAKMSGAAGSTLKIATFRMKDNSYREVTIKREPIEAQVYGRRISGKIGYLQINIVTDKSVTDFEARLKSLTGEGISGLVLDLRNTTGGGVDQAVKLADPFLADKDKVIAKVQDKTGVRSVNASPKTTHVKVPVVVLQNLGTGGAAEVAAAALQDNHRAILLGETTGGAGVYSEPQPLVGNLLVQVATTYVQSPSGKDLMTKGVAADITESMDSVPAKGYKKFREEFLAFCKGAPAAKEGGSKEATSPTTATSNTTSTAATAPTTGAPADEDEEDEPAKDANKPEAKLQDQVLGEYPTVRKYDNELMRAVNLLISTNIFFEQTQQN